MKRTNFTFSSYHSGRHRLGGQAVKTRLCNATAKRTFKKLRNYLQHTLQSAALCKTGAAFSLAMALGIGANAQCKTFYNADAANPIRGLLHGSEQIYSLDFVDIDADGDLDCYAKIYSDEAYIPAIPILFRNVGTSTFPVFKRDANTGFATTNDGYYTFGDIQFADMDGDGDFDCFIGESYSFGGTTIHYYENQGTATQPVFVANEAKNPVGFAYAFYGMTFTIADIDSDGDLDLAYTTDVGFYETVVDFNTGTKTQPSFQLYSRSKSSFNTREYYDFNGDGLPDYVDNPYGGGQEQYLNLGPADAPKYRVNPPGAPQFQNGIPYRFVDLNGDGFPEVFNFNGGYATTAPVAVITAKAATTGNFSYTLLTSTNQSPTYKYQWKLNGVNIPGATRVNYPAYKNGNYTLAITDACGTGLSLPYSLKTTANAEESSRFITELSSPGVSVAFVAAYPNPFTAQTTVNIRQPAAGTSLIKVVDLAGRTVFTKQTSAATVTLGSTLKPGAYTLQVWQKGGLVFAEKLIKE